MSSVGNVFTFFYVLCERLDYGIWAVPVVDSCEEGGLVCPVERKLQWNFIITPRHKQMERIAPRPNPPKIPLPRPNLIPPLQHPPHNQPAPTIPIPNPSTPTIRLHHLHEAIPSLQIQFDNAVELVAVEELQGAVVGVRDWVGFEQDWRGRLWEGGWGAALGGQQQEVVGRAVVAEHPVEVAWPDPQPLALQHHPYHPLRNLANLLNTDLLDWCACNFVENVAIIEMFWGDVLFVGVVGFYVGFLEE
jgi:hypothetical protein